MELITQAKSIKLLLRTRKLIDIANTLKEKNFEDAFFKAQREKDLDALSKIIYILSENDDKSKPFKTSSEASDFIDDYKAENGKTYDEIFNDLAKVINEEGFFNSKMTEEEMKEKLDGLMSSINMQDIVKGVAEKTVANVAEQEFKGYRG